MCLSYSFCRYATLAVLFWTVLNLSSITTKRLESNSTSAHQAEANPLYLKEHVRTQPYHGLFEFNSSKLLSGDEPPEVKGSFDAIVNALNKDGELRMLAYYHFRTQARQYNRCNRRWRKTQGQLELQHTFRPNRTIVVIIGLPQSGTSFLHKLMSRAPGKDGKPVFRTPAFWKHYDKERSARLSMLGVMRDAKLLFVEWVDTLILQLSQYKVGYCNTVALLISGLIDRQESWFTGLTSLLRPLEQPTKKDLQSIRIPQAWIHALDHNLDLARHIIHRWILNMKSVLTRYLREVGLPFVEKVASQLGLSQSLMGDVRAVISGWVNVLSIVPLAVSNPF